MGEENFTLPPGFQFRPTDEELVLHFLYHKSSDSLCYPDIIPDLDFHLHNPWELDGKALSSGNQWYFFSRMTENKVVKNGFWKQLDVEEPVFPISGKELGIKKYFVFYISEHLVAAKSNWVMTEYSLCSTRRNRKLVTHNQDYTKWVLCRVYETKGDFQLSFCNEDDDDDSGSDLSCLDEMFLSLDDDLDEICSN